MIQYWWVPVALVMYVAYAYFSKQANDSPGWSPLLILYGLQCIGLWPIVARYSKNLLFDGLLFDTLMILSYYGMLVYLGAGKGFTTTQWAGTAAVILGILAVKTG